MTATTGTASNYSANNQRVRAGKEALVSYANWMVDWYPDKYKLSYAQLESQVLGRNPDFLAQLGDAVIMAGIGQRRLDEAMERVAEKTSLSPLTIPDVMGFIDGVTKEISEFDFSLFGDAALDIAQSVSKGSVEIVDSAGSAVKNVAVGATNVVSNAAESVSFFSKYLKWILLVVLGVALFILFKVGKNFKAGDLALIKGKIG